MGKLHFETKEEANLRREQEFLALSPSERVRVFIRMVGSNGLFESGAPKKNKGNFVIKKKDAI